jgi:hypothetical protein
MSLARNLPLTVIVLSSTGAIAQYPGDEFSGAESSPLHRFDATHGVLFFRRGFLLLKSSPPLRS